MGVMAGLGDWCSVGDLMCWVRKRSRHRLSHFGSVPATVAHHWCSYATLAVLHLG